MNSTSHPGLRDAATSFLSHLCEALLLRGRLVSLELAEERRRLFSLLAVFALTTFATMMAVIMFTIFAVMFLWERSPLVGLGFFAGLYAVVAAVGLWKLKAILNRLSAPLADTVKILREDYKCVFGEQEPT